MVKWLKSEGMPLRLEASLCSVAAAAGNLEILMLLRSLKCPCDREASTSAFIHGHLEIVSWLAQQGCASQQQCLHGVYPVGSPTWAKVPQGGRSLKLPAQQLLGRSLSDSSTAALKSSYRNEVFAKECFLPEHLQQLLVQRSAAISLTHS